MEEQFVDIPGFDGYRISNTGKVWSDKSHKEIRQFDSVEYKIVHLRKKGKSFSRRVHRLVAQAFMENYSEDFVVNHIDGNKTNNHLDNLQCITRSENSLHSVWVLDNGHTAKRNHQLTDEEKQQIIAMRESGATVDEILEMFNISSAKYRQVASPQKRNIVWKKKPLPVENGERIVLVDGYEYYYVSDLGNVYSMKTGRRLAQQKIKTGYMQTALYKGGRETAYLTHRLVAQAFCDRPQGCDFVDHINECKTDNRAVNLRWVTRKQNLQSGMKKTRVITDEQIDTVRLMRSQGLSCTEISNATGITKTSVLKIINGQERFSRDTEEQHNLYIEPVPYSQDRTFSNKAVDMNLAIEIRERYALGLMTMKQMAQEYNIGRSTIHRIIRGLGGYQDL